MADNKTASDYLREAMAVSANPRPTAIAPTPQKITPFRSETLAGSGKPDPVGWLIDMISRPLYTMLEPVDTAMDAVAKAPAVGEMFRKGDVGGALGSVAGTIGDVASAPFRGLLSTNSNDKPLTSSLIEKVTDTAGALTNPDYKDEQDNVNPILKGVLGFVGDVGLDPLTYVPGAAIASVGKKVLGAAKGGSAIAKAGIEGAREAVAARKPTEAILDSLKPTEEAVDVAPAPRIDVELPSIIDEATTVAPIKSPFDTKAVRYDPTDAKFDLARLSDEEFNALKADREAFVGLTAKGTDYSETYLNRFEARRKSWDDALEAEASRRGALPPKPVQTSPVSVVAKEIAQESAIPASVGELMRGNPRTGLIQKVLKDIEKMPTKAAPTAPKQLDRGSWMKEAVRFADAGDEDAALRIVLPTGKRQYITYTEATARMQEPAVREALLREYAKYAEQITSGEAVDALGRAVKSSPVEELTTMMQRFEAKLVNDQAAVESALGTGLVDQLRRMAPEKFESAIEQLSKIVSDSGLMDDMAAIRKGSVVEKLFKVLDIDPIAVGVARREATSNVREAIKPNEIFERISDPKLGADIDPAERQAIEDVLASLPEVIRKNFLSDKYDDIPDYDYSTLGGTRRTADIRGEGLGANPQSINTYFQYDLYKTINQRVTKRVDSLPRTDKPFFQQRANMVKEQTDLAMEKAERLLDINGAPFHLDYQQEKIALSYQQVIKQLSEADPDTATLLARLYHSAYTAAAPTLLSEAVVMAVRGASKEEVLAKLASVAKRESAGDIPNWLAKTGDEAWSRVGYLVAKPVRTRVVNGKTEKLTVAAPAGHRYVKHAAASGKKGFYIEMSADYAREQLANSIMRSSGALGKLAEENAAAYVARYKEESFDMTMEVMEQIEELVGDPTKLAEALNAVARVSKTVKKTAAENGTRVDSARTAAAIVDAALPPGAKSNARAAVAVERAVDNMPKGADVRATDDALRIEAARPAQQKAFEEGAEQTARDALEAEAALKIDDFDLASKTAFGDVHTGIMRIIDPLNKAFNAQAGLRGKIDLYPLLHSSGVLHKTLMGRVAAGMNDLAKKYGDLIPGTTDRYLDVAFRKIQGLKDADNTWQSILRDADPKTAQAILEMERYLDGIFDVSGKNGILGNVFFRSNAGLEHINAAMKQFEMQGATGEYLFFNIDKAVREAAENGTDLLHAASNQWREWDIPDPLDFISKLNSASVSLATDVAVAQSLVYRLGNAGLGSSMPRAGFVRVTASEETKFFSLFPEPYYVDKDIAEPLRRFNEVAAMSKRIDGEFGNFIHKYFDVVQGAWKYAITLPRPGHHIRNLLGDESMTFMAEGVVGAKKSAHDAFKLLAMKNDYEGVDLIRALNSLDDWDLPTKGEVLSTGKYGSLTSNAIFDSAMKQGLLPPAHIIEDIFEAESGSKKLKSVTDAITFRNGKVEKLVSGVSEARDHYTRLKHFMQIIDKAQKTGKTHTGAPIKDVEALMEYAAKRVKLYHPDASLLSNFETKYMRRVIPFYSWMRGAVVALAESVAMNPARFNAMNKASFNLAVSMGVHPDSLTEPFPEDQLFPSFLTEQVQGPQFKVGGSYFGISPGIAAWDVLNTLGNDPVRGIAGSVSPLLRTPAELLSGGSWGTGAQIKDNSDYLDASIPGVNYLSNMTGMSATGSIVSALQGQGLDPQYQQAAGNKGPADQALSAFNWVTGLGLQNMSKPNYINYAEIEKRNAEGGKDAGF